MRMSCQHLDTLCAGCSCCRIPCTDITAHQPCRPSSPRRCPASRMASASRCAPRGLRFQRLAHDLAACARQWIESACRDSRPESTAINRFAVHAGAEVLRILARQVGGMMRTGPLFKRVILRYSINGQVSACTIAQQTLPSTCRFRADHVLCGVNDQVGVFSDCRSRVSARRPGGQRRDGDSVVR